MSRSREELLDEIEDLKDQIHDLTLDLRDSRTEILSLQCGVEVANAETARLSTLLERVDVETEQEKKDHEAHISKLMIEMDSRLEECIKIHDHYKRMRLDYKRMLSMWESVSQGNYHFFERTNEGIEFLRWVEDKIRRTVDSGEFKS